MIAIYVLRCPTSGDIRYVGKTKNPKSRLTSHLSAARTGRPQYCPRWIAGLLRQGLLPTMEIVDNVPEEEWAEYETRAIADHKAEGHRLTNMTSGGDGFHDVDPDVIRRAVETRRRTFYSDPEAMARFAESIRVARNRPEAKLVMVAKIKASWEDPEKRANYLAGMNTPEALARRSEISRERMADPEFLAEHCRKVQERFQQPEHLEQIKRAGEIARADPEVEARRRAAIKAAYQTPEAKHNLAAAMVEVNARPEVKQKRADSLRKRMADPEQHKLLCERSPETRAKMSESATKRWADPVRARAAKEALNTPERIQRRAEMAVWKASPEHRAMRAAKGRAERAVKRAERELAKLKAEAEERASRLL